MSTDGQQPHDDRPGWDAPRPGKPTPPQYGAMTPDGGHPFSPGAPSPATGTPPSYGAPMTPNTEQPPAFRQPAQAAGYGQPGGYAAGNMQLPQPGPVPALPRLVNTASILLVVGAAVAMVQAILQAIVFSSMPLSEFKDLVMGQAPAGMEAEYGKMMDSMSQGLVTSVVITTIALYAVGAILAVLVAVLTRKGSNAWRIVGTVCGALATLANLASVTNPLSLVLAVLGILIIVFWWLPESNRWFAAIRRNKALGFSAR